MDDSVTALQAITDPAERLEQATRLLIELNELTLRVAQVQRDALEQIAPAPLDLPLERQRLSAVLRWLKRSQCSVFSEREALSHMPRSLFSRMDVVRTTLATLEERGAIRALPEQPRAGRGRPASARYRVLPDSREQ